MTWHNRSVVVLPLILIVIGSVAFVWSVFTLAKYSARMASDSDKRQAVAEVKLELLHKERELEICRAKLEGYQEISALAEALERAQKGK